MTNTMANNTSGDKKSGNNECLTIGVRIRPLKSDELGRGYKRIVTPVDDKMLVLSGNDSEKLDPLRNNRVKDKKFMYDVVFPENCHQDTVYKKTTRPLIDDVLNGFNATIFAYGPTGTGKTFTMVGTPDQPGIMVRALNDLFKKMESGNEKFNVSMSYLEIYNEHVRDLLHYTGKTLELREDPKNGLIQVTGLSAISTTSTKEVMRLLQKGNKERISESTAANLTSSRSHAMLQVNVHLSSHGAGQSEEVKTGRLFMVDLAGSERAKMTQNRGIRLQEGAHINKSLLALANVINALAEGRAKFVNFRDSKLTRLLKDALSGNCKTVMIAHVSPSNRHIEESKNTLTYADRAKNISNTIRQTRVDVAYHIEQYKQIIAELKEEIARLKVKLNDGDTGSTNRSSTPTNRGNERVGKMKVELVSIFTTMMDLRKKIMEIDGNILSVSMELERINLLIVSWESEQAQKDPDKKVKGRDTPDTLFGEDEPEEITQAYEDIVYLEGEQKRYLEMREAMLREMNDLQKRSKDIEENLPKVASSSEQKETLNLLCKVHKFEIQQVELESQSLIQEHELRRRELQILRYDRQVNLCDEIITKQRSMIEGNTGRDTSGELKKLYALYQMESQNLERSPSVLSFRGNDKLPPISPNIRESQEMLFKPVRRHSLTDDKKPSTPLTVRSPLSSNFNNRKWDSLKGRTSSTPSLTSQSSGKRKLFPPI